MSEGLGMWVVYEPGTDGQRQYVARWWWVAEGEAKPTSITQHAWHLDQLRQAYAEVGFTCIARSPDDPYNVVETWL